MSEERRHAIFAPWRGGGGGVRMGLQPIEDAAWLRTPHDLDARLAEKRELYEHRYPDVVATLPGAEAAGEELASLLAHAVGFERQPGMSAIADAGLNVADDLCVMQPGRDGYVLTAASLCAPSNWRLHDKLGQPLPVIHSPIETLEERIGPNIARFFERLSVGRIFMRGNWHLNRSPALFQPPRGKKRPAEMTAENIGAKVWIRTERQTLRRLENTGAIAFTILVEVTPLSDLAREPTLVDDLLATFEAMHDADKRMRHWRLYERPLRAWRATLPT